MNAYVPGTQNGGFSQPHWGTKSVEDKRTPAEKERDKQLGQAIGKTFDPRSLG